MKLAQLVERKRSSGRGSIYSIQPYASVRETVRLLCEHRVGALLVVDDAQEVRGIVTERDVLNMIHSRSSSLEDVRVEEIMTRKVAIAQAEDTIQHALQVMSENNIRHLPVGDENGIVAVLSITDLLHALYNQDEICIRHMGDMFSGSHGLKVF
jgi:CBS-domain-containing membrane protein